MVGVLVIILMDHPERHTQRSLIRNVTLEDSVKVDPGLTPSIKTLNMERNHNLPRENNTKELNILDVTSITAREISKLVPEDMVINLIHAEPLVLNTDISPSKTTVGAHATTLMLLPELYTREELIKNVTKVVLDKEVDGEMPSI